MDLYLEELERALQAGDSTVASELARIFAEQKLNLKLKINEASAPAQNLPEKKINVKVIIEDRYTTNVSITLSLLPSMKFTELKTLMFEKFEFPPQTQKWLAGKRLAKDTDMLRNCGIRKDNDIIYLYLVSAQSVGLTREAVEVQPRQHTYSETCSGSPEQFLNEADNPHVVTSENNTAQRATVGWECPKCTFINEPTRPGCSVCSTSRPDDYAIPPDHQPSDSEQVRLEQERRFKEEADQERETNFQHLVATEENNLIPNTEAFECPVCFDDVPPLTGVVLRDCLHTFCRECLLNQIRHADSSVVTCPNNDGHYQCPSTLQDREIKALVPLDIYLKHLTLSLVEAESRSANSFHCQTPNCIGWCIYEDDVNVFKCEVCGRENCLTCKAIHEGISCKQFQDDVKIKAKNDIAAKQTQDKLEAMLQKGDAMKCPTCDIIVTKKDGCDWLRCTMCKTEICWVTKGPRWGPMGSGDTSGGCRCGVDGPCHRNCQNCH